MDDVELKHRRLHLSGSAPVVTSLLLSGDRIIAASDDHKIRVFSFEKNTLSYVLEGHLGGVWAVDVLDDSDTLVSGSTDATVRVWDLQSGRCTYTFKGHEGTVRCIKIAKPERTAVGADTETTPEQPLIVSGSRDSTLRVWRLPSHGDKDFATAEGDEALKVASNPYHKFLLEGHTAAVRGLAVHGRVAISGSYDCSVRVWDIEKGESMWNFEGHTQKVYAVAYDSSRNFAYSGSMDMTVRVWNLENGQCSRVLSGHTSLVGLVNISPNNIASGSADGTLRIWDPDSGDLKHVLSTFRGAIVALAHDDDRIICTGDCALILCSTRDGIILRDLWPEVGGRNVWQVALNGQRCVASSTTDDPGEMFIDTWSLGGEEHRDREEDVIVQGFVVVPPPETQITTDGA